ncbi:TPA: restriction endonuclease subunit S [Escherichia coli]|uniref:Restriction endonuclease subunit S n=1 Tax=Escherichia coli TaxID=562 RepID=A0A7L7EBD6_ECOLX|nr:restriction endonuclease subunit S [Escherichia coli]EFK1739649.1 restriction endonuclease subunit S [Escherichia coli]EFU6055652.1 restriction endonuclease subunit S [Escherichia coli]KAB3447773.1 restriction endonuclease subunit S [Escherichia coli]MBA8439330.1 restriction endonuclease subunit S [Escherichia coli]MDD8932547.1 restriction endonuclease subunit S [Escherichia coli]
MSEKTRPESWLSKIAIDCFDQISTTNNKVKSTACSPHGLYPVIDQGQNYISGYINDESKLIKITTPICIFGDHTRIIKWVEHNFVPGADGTKLLKPKDFIYPRYAYYSLCALNIPDKGYSRHFKYFKELKIDIPAWEEQKIIAEKLDTLLAQVDSTKTRLEQIPQILKRFRQAVLAAVVNGKLSKNTKQWEIYLLKNLCTSISDGDHQAPPKSETGIPFLVISDVNKGVIDFDNVSRWVPESYYQSLKEIRKPCQYDILYTVTGSYGIPVIVNNNKPFCFQRHIAIIKPNRNLIDHRFLAFYLESPQIFKHASDVATGTAQKTVSLSSLRNFEISVPPLKEQHEIVRRVEQLFAYADTIEKQVNNALARVNNLTQSILAKAFRGELTTQWRAENPDLISGENSAAALLEKIKAERAASGGKKASRKKS